MSKQKRRERRRYKQLLKRLEACDTCAYLAAITDLVKAKQVLGNANFQCPSCGRELLVPMHADGVGRDVFEKALHSVGEAMKDPNKPRPTHFRFTLNDEEIFADSGWNQEAEDTVVCTVKFELPEEDFTKFKSLKEELKHDKQLR